MISVIPAIDTSKPSLAKSILGVFLGITLIFVQYAIMYGKNNILIDLIGVIVTASLAILVARVFAPKELSTFNTKTLTKSIDVTKALSIKLFITIGAMLALRLIVQPQSFITIAESFTYYAMLHTSTVFIEETTFRAIALTALIQMMPNSGIDKKAPILISAIFFAMFHVIIGNPVASVIRMILSGTLGYLCGKWMIAAKSIIPGMIAHFTTNMTLSIVSSQISNGTYPTLFDKGIAVVCFVLIVIFMIGEIKKVNMKPTTEIDPII